MSNLSCLKLLQDYWGIFYLIITRMLLVRKQGVSASTEGAEVHNRAPFVKFVFICTSSSLTKLIDEEISVEYAISLRENFEELASPSSMMCWLFR